MRRGGKLAWMALVATAGAITLCACASLPPVTPARLAKAPQAYETAQTFAAPAVEWPADAWWKAYGDPQLDSLIDQALAGSPTLAQAEARVRSAQALSARAVAAGLPRVSAYGTVQEVKATIPPILNGYNDTGVLSLNVNWDLDFFGRNRAAVEAATSRTQAAMADVAEARLTLTTTVAAAYAELARLYAQRDVAARALAIREETQGLVEKRVINGLDTQAELKQAEAGPPAARAELDALDEQIALTRNALAALIGEGPDKGLAIQRPGSVSLKPFGLPESLPSRLIGRRPDIVAAKWRAEAETHQVSEAKRAFYPDINLTGRLGQGALSLDQILTSASTFGLGGPAVSLPILDGGRLRADLRGAQAERDAAVASYDEAVTQALREVADVAASERALSERLAQSRAALAADEEAHRIARLRYDGALANYQSVLLAEDAVLAERRVVTDLENRSLVLDVGLIHALGGGFANP
jgi:NodT family efflux transporter outer membrane factor (OMF) lipoprotein